MLPLDTKNPSTRLLHEDEYEAGDASPRTKVSRKFGDLTIDGGAGFRKSDLQPSIPELPTLPALAISHHPDLTALSSGQDQQDEIHSGGLKAEVVVNTPAKDASASSICNPKALRPRSPPLDGEPSDVFWNDSEITGHDPDDPNDDGYGINGIGFRPTPAIAWSRSQKRKQQLTELRNREAREARQERSERRKRPISESDDVSGAEASPRKNARVHFEEG